MRKAILDRSSEDNKVDQQVRYLGTLTGNLLPIPIN